MPTTWCPRLGNPGKMGDPLDGSVGCYLTMRPLPFALLALDDVSLLVCMSSPMYLGCVSRSFDAC
jgi:hypothetical protein